MICISKLVLILPPANVEPTVELGDISTPEEVTTVNQKEEAVSEVQPSTEDVDTAKVDVTEIARGS